MKIQAATSILETLTAKEIIALTTQVSETLVKNSCNKKVFTSLDLWGIQKKRKNYATRNFS